MKGLLEKNRIQLNKELPNMERRQFFSPVTHYAYQTTAPAILSYARGKLLDIGCGDMPYKDLIQSKVDEYDTFDTEKRAEGVTFIGDVQNMDMITDASYDSAICLEVLEHVKYPHKALSEICRILKPGGVLILSAPHLSRLHEQPNDFFRYTKYGLSSLLEEVNFDVVEITPRGGIFSFLGHQSSTGFVCLFWNIPVVKWLVFFLNKWLCVKVCYFLDKIFDKKKILASGYTCVAKKR